MFLQIAATIVGLLLTIAASLWGINGLRQDYGLALGGYGDLRRVFETGSHLATARTLLTQTTPDRDGALREVRLAAGMFQMKRPATEQGGATLELSTAAAVKSAIDSAAQHLAAPAGDEGDVESVAQALGRIGDLAAEIRQQIQASQDAARGQRHATVAAMLSVSALAVISALALGIWQYRGVMGPLARLSVGVRTVAGGKFSQRIATHGKDEFALLAADFNRMAAELDGLYQNLERKVAEKSRELVRSERLASVGYLAAGVAHEINNPLGIISGHAEMSLEQLQQPNTSGNSDDDEVTKSLQIIRDEAFRCKQIIAKLLSLSRAGDEARSEVDLATVTRQVIAMIGGLPDYRQRKMEFVGEVREGTEKLAAATKLRDKGEIREGTKGQRESPRRLNCGTEGEEGKSFVVMANEVEMKQVALNLLINALEASPGDGIVEVAIVRDDGAVRLSVLDHGKGMTAETAQRVFEPFFTDKKGTGHNGTGLGLSITHAIVTSHGGRIWAESDGPGKGSRFSIELPAAAQPGGLS
jgi:signal transduction histidine kinase